MDCVYILKELAYDRVSSSFSIASKMLDCSIKIFGDVHLEKYIEEIMRQQASMSLVLNVADRIIKAKSVDDLVKLKSELVESEKKAVFSAAGELEGVRKIATISFSSSVFETLKSIKPQIVFVSVSHPACEGEKLAAELKKSDIDVVLFEDAAYSLVIEDVEAALIGADAVFDDGVVNKVGSLCLALLCREFKKPFYVVANRFKRLGAGLKNRYKILDMPKNQITGLENVKVINRYFELVPFGFITRLFDGGN